MHRFFRKILNRNHSGRLLNDEENEANTKANLQMLLSYAASIEYFM